MQQRETALLQVRLASKWKRRKRSERRRKERRINGRYSGGGGKRKEKKGEKKLFLPSESLTIQQMSTGQFKSNKPMNAKQCNRQQVNNMK